MKLPVPIFFDEKIYTDVEYRRPKTGVITTTYEIAQKGNIFGAIVELINGCVKNITSIDGDVIENPAQIKKLIRSMPYNSAETLSIKIMASINGNDILEGVYNCPRCGKQNIPNYNPELGIDERDRVNDLKINYMKPEEFNNEIDVIPEEPVKFINEKTGEVIKSIESFTIKFPVMQDCILAGSNSIAGSELRTQFKIYIQSLFKVNDEIVQATWGRTWGKLLFDNLYPEDVSQIGDVLQKYGIDKRLKKTCQYCGRNWEALINTSNFFASGLQPT